MTVTIYQSTKFDYAREQYYAEAGDHTLLRLTCGNLGGKPGGAIKTATASDFGAAPVYRNRDGLTAAMRLSVPNLGGRAQDVSIEIDGKGRRFGEVTLQGSRDELIEVLRDLAEEMDLRLGRSSESVLYDDLCVVESEPVYLSDGVYLDPDGRLLE
ncbi:hypothetical protein [Candidatus Halocynthiibacter alkanivorans]|uniref:hypothetical protein n=1 Tax=Candidatus Halocynthiibacter alkanivorans TaxID=2267619 RepID=UPI000DF3CAFD|nr:hypothetical protein [Candidatus Halocynthiibacter alkanivorans]